MPLDSIINHSIYLEKATSSSSLFVSHYLRRIETEEDMEELLIVARKNDREELQTYLHDWFG